MTNLDGSTTNLSRPFPLLSHIKPQSITTIPVFDVHQYLDSDYSGTHAECVINGITAAFTPLLNYLKDSNRQALLSETGGGSDTASCLTNVCEALDFLNENSDSFVGWVGWAAGSFATTYVLSLTPSGDTDVPLMTQCFAGKFGGGAGTSNATTPSTPQSSAGATPPSTTTAPVSIQPGPSYLASISEAFSTSASGSAPTTTPQGSPSITSSPIPPFPLPSGNATTLYPSASASVGASASASAYHHHHHHPHKGANDTCSSTSTQKKRRSKKSRMLLEE